MWFDPNLRTSEDKEQLRALQLKREAFRPFSERVVSARCASILQPTLDGLDKVGKAIRDSRETREAFLLLNPVLDALTNSLDMTETFYYYVELTPEEIEQEKKMVEEEEKEEEKTPSLSTVERTRQRALRLHELESKRLLTSWTEEKEPQLLFKYRLRNVEKRLAAFQYVLEFVPDPVRQELEERGFVQQTKNLRTNVRSLLTCEGVTHVTMATLKDELGGRETDDFMDHNAARKAMDDFSRSFHTRLLFQRMGARMPDEHAVSIFQKTVNTTQVESRWSVGYREGIEQLKNTLAGLSAPDIKFQWARQDSRQKIDQVEENQPFSPEIKYIWTAEAVVRLWRATRQGYKESSEVAVALFQH
ncbi:hypothetical protein EMPS_10803 [Entomortierella parvispora]|uniref:Uncharacterized protein n=1 Tax=Entomortierella parvispora TaxID=205924 RepID=A0A9P3M1I9_9FUNG|nr:hypothetical protein EMPS_10803 [Entomortierella parvispora]